MNLQYPPPRSAPFLEKMLVAQVWSGWFRRIAETFNANQAVTVVGGLSPSALIGQHSFVTDATATTFASIVVGGGGHSVPVYFDGTNWRIG